MQVISVFMALPLLTSATITAFSMQQARNAKLFTLQELLKKNEGWYAFTRKRDTTSTTGTLSHSER